MAQTLRIDAAEIIGRMERTDEGYLRGRARIARIGVQNYQNADGSVRRELRHPDDVFAQSAQDSLKMAAVTLGHPSERLVNADNAKRLSIGHLGETVTVDGRFVVAPIVITDSAAIDRIESGTQELSVGYLADVEAGGGTYDGQEYDYRQRNIRANHVAVVDTARGGPELRLNLDANDAVSTDQEPEPQLREDAMSDRKTTVRVDGIEYECPPEVERALAKANERADTAEKAVTDAKTEAETAKAKADAAAEELEKFKAERSDAKIAEAVQARLGLERQATAVLGKDAKFDGVADQDIRRQVVLKVHPEAKLDDVSEAYLAARYDAAIDTHKAHGDAMAGQRQTANAPGDPRGDAGYKRGEDAKKEAMEDMMGAYKKRDRKKEVA